MHREFEMPEERDSQVVDKMKKACCILGAIVLLWTTMIAAHRIADALTSSFEPEKKAETGKLQEIVSEPGYVSASRTGKQGGSSGASEDPAKRTANGDVVYPVITESPKSEEAKADIRAEAPKDGGEVQAMSSDDEIQYEPDPGDWEEAEDPGDIPLEGFEEEEQEQSDDEETREEDRMSRDEFEDQGVYYGENGAYTYYSDGDDPGEGIDVPGMTVDEEGYVTDGDGYVVLASCDYGRGTEMSIPFGCGKGKVYDYCPTSGVIDVYTTW